MDSLLITWLRFALAVLFFVPFLYGARLKLPDLASWGRYFLVASAYTVYFLAMFEALKTTTSLNTSTIYTAVPFVTALFSYLLLAQKTTLKQLFFMAVSILLVLWVIFRGSVDVLLSWKFAIGDMIFAIGSLFMAAYIPLTRKMYRDEGVNAYTFWILVASCVILTVFAMPQIVGLNPLLISSKSWVLLFYLAFFSTAITFWLVQTSARHLHPVEIISYTYLMPGIVALIDWLWLGIELDLPTLIAIFLLVIFVALIQISKEDKK